MNTPHLPDLELLRIIGSGSYGDVWIARTVTGLYRAVKVVSRDRFKDDRPWLREFSGVSRFHRDMGGRQRQLALLHVGNDESQNLFFYVMELADDLHTGPDIVPESYVAATLKAVRERRPEMPLDEVLRIGIDLARSLAELHEAGLIHRDIKPSNIVFVQGVPKLADLGLVSSTEHTMTSLGTPGYSPPDDLGTPRSDVYSLGMILYELAMRSPTSDFPTLPSSLAASPDAPRLLELNEVLLRACHKDASQRFASASEFLAQLILVQAGGSLREMASMRERLRLARKALFWLAAAAALVGLLLGIKNYHTLSLLARSEADGRARAEADARLSQYSSDVHLAHLAADSGNVGAVLAALRRGFPAAGLQDLRGPEWWALWNAFRSQELRSWTPEKPRALSLLLLPSKPDLLIWQSQSRTGATGTLNTRTGASLSLLTDTRGLGVPDRQGKLLINSAKNELLDLDIDTGRSEPWPQSRGILVASTPDRAVTGEMQGSQFTLKIWDRSTRLLAASWTTPASTSETALNDVSLSADSRLLAVSYYYGGNARRRITVLHDLLLGKDLLSLPSPRIIQCVRLSHDGTRLAIGGTGWLGVYALPSGETLWLDEHIPGNTVACEWSPDDLLLATGGSSQVLRLHDTRSGKLVRTLRGAENDISSIAWNPDSSGLFLADGGGVARKFQLSHTQPPLPRLENLWSGVLFAQYFDKNPSRCLLPWADGKLSLTELRTGLRLATWSGALLPLSRSPDDKGWLALSDSNQLVLCPDGSGELPAQSLPLALPENFRLNGLAVDLNGSRAALASADGRLETWDLSNNRRRSSMELGDRVVLRSVLFSQDGESLLLGDSKGVIYSLPWTEGNRPRRQVTLDSGINGMTCSRDGRLLAAGLQDGRIQILNTKDLSLITTLQGHRGKVFALVFHTDDSRLISGGADGAILYWNTHDWRLFAAKNASGASPNGASVPVWGLDIDPSGAHLTILGQGGLLWHHEIGNHR